MIAIYVDRGALKWDDTLDKWFKQDRSGLREGHARSSAAPRGRRAGRPPDELWKQLWADGDKPDARAKFVAGHPREAAGAEAGHVRVLERGLHDRGRGAREGDRQDAGIS